MSEFVELAEPLGQAIEPLGALGREELLRCLDLVLPRPLEVEASGLDQLHERLRPLFQGVDDPGEPTAVSRNGEPGFRDEGLGQLGQAQAVHRLHVLLGEPEELGLVEDRAGGRDVLDVEQLDELGAREDLLVAVRPAQAGQIVHHRVSGNALVAERLHRGGAVALGEPAPIGAQDHRHVGELRYRIVEGLVAEDLLGRVREVVVAPDDVSDLHRHVVHDHAEVVGRRAVGTHEDPVVELAVLEGNGAVDQVVDDGRPRVGNAQPQRARRQAAVAAAARVAERLLACLGRLALLLEHLGRAVAVVRPAGVEEASRVVAVEVEALGLPVAGRRRALVPIELEPPERVDDEADVLVGRARPVGVLDPEDEDAAVTARVEPVEQRRARAADVQVPGRAGREAHADARRRRAVHNNVILPRAPSGAGEEPRGDEPQYDAKRRPHGVASKARIRARPTVGYHSQSW